MSEDYAINILSQLITDYYITSISKPTLGAALALNFYLFQIDSICNEFPDLREPARHLLFEV